jgi:hypothetical protein
VVAVVTDSIIDNISGLLIALLFSIQNLLELFDIETIPREIFSGKNAKTLVPATVHRSLRSYEFRKFGNVFCYVLTLTDNQVRGFFEL